jgi:hypothetical protein
VLVCALPSGASSRASTDWKHLPYLIYETQDMLITTDGSWDGATTVHPVQPGQNPQALSSDWTARHLKYEYIWAPRCLAGHQTVSFSKTFSIPGQPTQGNVTLATGFGYPLPIHSASYLVNSVEIARVGDATTGKKAAYVSIPLTPAAMRAFHYGPNRLTIRVDKAPLKKGETCNTRNRLIGALSQLSLRFEPDMVAVPSDKGTEQAVRKSAGEVVGALGNIRFQNNGPSGSPGGKLIFRIAANVMVETAWGPGTLQVSPPFHDCTGQGVGGPGVVGVITCEYDNFPAGLKDSIFVITGGRLAKTFPPNATTSLSLDWQIIPAGYDLHPENNSFSHTFIICGPTATDSRCIGAK